MTQSGEFNRWRWTNPDGRFSRWAERHAVALAIGGAVFGAALGAIYWHEEGSWLYKLLLAAGYALIWSLPGIGALRARRTRRKAAARDV